MTPYYDGHGITIYQGDCLEVMASLKAGSIDFVLTDPPYGQNNFDGDFAQAWKQQMSLTARRGRRIKSNKAVLANDGPEADQLVQGAFRAIKRLLVPGGYCACCCGGGGPDPQFARWALWLEQVLDFREAVVWDKGWGLGWHYRRSYEFVLVARRPGKQDRWYGDGQSNVMSFPVPKGQDKDGRPLHPTPKPLGLFKLFLKLHSRPRDLVLDPFMGGGTTLLAARQMGRRAIGIDIEERYCEMAVRRLEQGEYYGRGLLAVTSGIG